MVDVFLTLKLKLPNEAKECELTISDSATIGEFVEKVKEKCFIQQDKLVRLISSGKLLHPLNLPIKQFNISNSAFVHVVISDRSSSDAAGISRRKAIPRVGLLGFDTLMSTERDDSSSNPLLRHAFALSVDEVATIRTRFRNHVNEFITANRLEPSDLESDLTFRLRAEYSWMSAQTSESEFIQLIAPAANNPLSANNSILASFSNVSNNPSLSGISTGADNLYHEHNSLSNPLSAPGNETNPHQHDFMWGFAMGFIFGFIMIFCVWDRNVSRRQKHGILCGMVFQMITASFQQTPQKAKT